MSDILTEIFTHRPKSLGYNCNRFVELAGGREVPIQFYEPDPNTFRLNYYYNSRLNILYKKVRSSDAVCPNSFYWKALIDGCGSQ
jgi:hypothetical protein